MNSSPIITACVCTYNRYDLLPKAIDSLMKQSLAPSAYRIVVVDNSPDHVRAEEFGRIYAGQPLLTYHIERTPGLSNARNVGARMSGTELIAYMDDDAIASPAWLENLIAAFETFGPGVAIAGGRVDPIWEVPRPIWMDDSLLSYVSVVDWGGETRIADDGEWFAGTNIAFRTDAILSNGGFDTSLGRIGSGATLLSNEEIVILNRLREAGQLAIYAPEASVRHLVDKRRCTRTWMRKRVAWQAVSDFMSDPKKTEERGIQGWHWLAGYLCELPPKNRNVSGLFYDTDSPQLFKRQLDATYLYTVLSLSGFNGLGKD